MPLVTPYASRRTGVTARGCGKSPFSLWTALEHKSLPRVADGEQMGGVSAKGGRNKCCVRGRRLEGEFATCGFPDPELTVSSAGSYPLTIGTAGHALDGLFARLDRR